MIDNTSGVCERTVLESCLRVQLECLSDPESTPVLGARLIKPVLASSSLAAVINQSVGSINAAYVSRDASYGFLKRCSHSDLVVADINGSGTSSICQVWFHVECGETVWSCVSVFLKVGDNKYLKQDSPILVPLESVQDTCIFQLVGEHVLVVPSRF